jgi:hypothetical protein
MPSCARSCFRAGFGERDRLQETLAEIDNLRTLLLRCKNFLQRGDPEKDSRFSHLSNPEDIAEIMTQDCIRAEKVGEKLYTDLCAALAVNGQYAGENS